MSLKETWTKTLSLSIKDADEVITRVFMVLKDFSNPVNSCRRLWLARSPRLASVKPSLAERSCLREPKRQLLKRSSKIKSNFPNSRRVCWCLQWWKLTFVHLCRLRQPAADWSEETSLSPAPAKQPIYAEFIQNIRQGMLWSTKDNKIERMDEVSSTKLPEN